jgi:hypothetical protein
MFLNSTRLGQLTGSGLRSITKDSDRRTWRGMEMFLEQQVPADAPAMARVYEHSRINECNAGQAGRNDRSEGAASAAAMPNRITTISISISVNPPACRNPLLHRLWYALNPRRCPATVKRVA